MKIQNREKVVTVWDRVGKGYYQIDISLAYQVEIIPAQRGGTTDPSWEAYDEFSHYSPEDSWVKLYQDGELLLDVKGNILKKLIIDKIINGVEL